MAPGASRPFEAYTTVLADAQENQMLRHRTPFMLVLLAGVVVGSGCQAQAPAAEAASPASPSVVRPDETPAHAISREEAIEALGDSPIATVLDHLGDDAKAFNTHVVTLSNPFFEGRQPGTRGNALAADYIEHWFRQAGLAAAFPGETKASDGATVLTPHSSFRQTFPAHNGGRYRAARQTVSIATGGAARDLDPGGEFALLGCTADARATGPVVFVGYSIAEGSDGYTSYGADTDLTGKIALILRFEPMTGEGKSKWAESGWTPAASLDSKVKAALDRNAAGVILVNAPGAADERSKKLPGPDQTRLEIECVVPAVAIDTDVIDAMVRGGDPDGRSLLELRQLADDAGGVVVDLPGVVATLDTAIMRSTTQNVAGVLRGRGPLAEEYVIIGAHFDHVGVGPIGASPENFGKMHPGADDNASGTSGMLVLADKLSRAYAQAPADQPARSVLFIGFSDEEAGLFGSRHFVQNSPIARDRMYAMLNLDMIGRLREGKIEIGGVGTAEGFRDWLRPYFDESGLAIKPTNSGFGPSDHASFATAGVPVLFFFTQLHREYHTPADVGSTINQKGAARVIGMAEKIAMALATRSEALKAPKKDEKAPAEPAQPLTAGPMRVKVRFGIAPGDYSGEEPGVLVGDVYEGTSAAEARIRAGDLINSWNGQPVKSVQEWMPFLAGASPGDVVEIGLVRDGKAMTVKVTLKGRDQGGR